MPGPCPLGDGSAAPEITAREFARGLRPVRRRVRLVMGARWGLTTLTAAASAVLLATLFLRLAGIWYDPLWPILALTVTVFGVIAGVLWYRLDDDLLARSLDRRLVLKDRLTSALAMLAWPERSGMRQAVIADGAEHLASLTAADAYPFPPLQRWRTLGLALLVCTAAQVLPIAPLFLSSKQRQERDELRTHAEQIKPVVREFRQRAQQSGDPEARQTAKRLRQLQQDLLRGTLNKKRALLSLSEMQKDLQKLAEREQMTPEAARKAAAEMSKQAAGQLGAQAAQLAVQAQRQNKPELAKQLQKLAQQAQNSTSPKALRAAQGQLKSAAQSLGMDLPAGLEASLQDAEALAEASEALQKGNCQQAQLALQKAQSGKCKAANAVVATAAQQAAMAMAEAMAQMSGQCQGAGQQCQKPGSGLGIGPDSGTHHLGPSEPAATLYSPRDSGLKAGKDQVRGRVDLRQGGVIVGQTVGTPDTKAGSRVPYYEVVGEYQKSAEQAIQREQVPLAYRGTVREYFKALNGEGKGR